MCHVAGWPIPARRRAEHHQRAGARICNRSAARSIAGVAGRPPSTSCRPRSACCAICRRSRCCGSRATDFPPATVAALERYRYGMGVFKVDWALAAPIPWRPTGAARRARCTWAGRSNEIARIGAARRGKAASPIGRSCCSASRRCSIRRARRPASTWRGDIATCPAASTVEHAGSHRAADRAIRAGIPRCVLARSVMTPADIEAHNANSSAATSQPASPIAAVLHAADLAQLLDAGEGAVYLFGIDAARRRRARDVRVLRRRSEPSRRSDLPGVGTVRGGGSSDPPSSSRV